MTLSRHFALAYGVACYLIHWVATIWLIGFLGNLWWSKTIDVSHSEEFPRFALIVDLGLIVLFVFLHWVMARPWFKEKWTRYVPEPIERSTYVLATSLTLAFVFILWRPVGDDIWLAQGDTASRVLQVIYLLGWALAILSTFPINHWDLFGLRQVWLYWSNRAYTPPAASPSILYRLLPHPIFVGYGIALWSAARMGWAHFLFSSVLTAFLFIDVRLAAGEN